MLPASSTVTQLSVQTERVRFRSVTVYWFFTSSLTQMYAKQRRTTVTARIQLSFCIKHKLQLHKGFVIFRVSVCKTMLPGSLLQPSECCSREMLRVRAYHKQVVVDVASSYRVKLDESWATSNKFDNWKLECSGNLVVDRFQRKHIERCSQEPTIPLHSDSLLARTNDLYICIAFRLIAFH